MDEVQLQDVILDIVTGAIRSTDLSVDLYRWSDFPNFIKSQQQTITSPLDSYTDRMVCTLRDLFTEDYTLPCYEKKKNRFMRVPLH